MSSLGRRPNARHGFPNGSGSQTIVETPHTEQPQTAASEPASGTTPAPTSVSQKWYRISLVPTGVNENDLRAAIQSIDPSLNDAQFRLVLYPSNNAGLQTVLLQFESLPKYFQDLNDDKPNYAEIFLGTGGDAMATKSATIIIIDSTFNDLTQLNAPTEDVVADVIAVTGLGGHAYESWTNRDTLKMWLHDFLPSSFKNVRIMTYGYDSKLAGEPKTRNTLLDYRRHFVTTLKNSRASEADNNRPIIFIGHGLGAVLIVEALTTNKQLADATKCIMFFGAPNRGLDTSDLEVVASAVRGPWAETRVNLVQGLSEDAECLEARLEKFVELLETRGRDLRIISFYEQALTSKFEMTASGPMPGSELTMRTSRFSSVLYTPYEERVGVLKNNTDMVRFDTAIDKTYQTVVMSLGECLENIKQSAEEGRQETAMLDQ